MTGSGRPGILRPPICRGRGAAGPDAGRQIREGASAWRFGGSILTWFDGRWHAGNLPVMRAADHGTWQGTLVFDGARAFEGVTPDLDLHCDRVIRSAEAMGLAAPLGAREIEALIREGIAPARHRPRRSTSAR